MCFVCEREKNRNESSTDVMVKIFRLLSEQEQQEGKLDLY